MKQRTRRMLTVLVTGVALLLGTASLALASIVDRIHYSFTDSFTDEACGIEVEVELEGRGVFMVRQDKPGSPAFFASNNYSFREVVTNPQTGQWIVVTRKGNFREVKATHVDGDVYLFRAHESGQPFVIEDSSGRVVYRERGLLVYEILFDTLGDDEPGGEELNFDLVAVRGFPGAVDDVCPIVQDLLG